MAFRQKPWLPWWLPTAVALLAAFVAAILLLGGMETWRRWKTRKEGMEGNQAYYRVKPAHRLAVAVVFIGLIAVCAVGMDLTFVDRSSSI